MQENFGSLVIPILNNFLTHKNTSLSNISSILREASLKFPILYCPVTPVVTKKPLLGKEIPNTETVIMCCDVDGNPYCFNQLGLDIKQYVRWPIQKHLYNIRNYYYFIGMLSNYNSKFTVYCIWTFTGIIIKEPLFSRIVSHLKLDTVQLTEKENHPILYQSVDNFPIVYM